MEVAIPVNGMDFDFHSSYTISAPSTSRPMGDQYYFSAPTSPTRLSEFCHEFEDLLIAENNRNSCATVPFAWEERPGKPKSPKHTYEDDFAFDVSGEFGSFDSLSAEDLFDGGMIKPLKPPPRLQRLPTDDENNKIICGALSPREKKEANTGKRTPERERGRERVVSALTSPSRRTRSFSPLRVSQYPWEEEQTKQSTTTTNPKSLLPSSNPSALSASSSKGSKKWRLKDLFLFRSASDGRAMDRDPFRKYTALLRKHEDFRNSNGSGSGSGSGLRRRGRVSAHELHYTVNRAVSNDMKKKTFLPYKQGILGRLAFNPTVNGFGFQHK